MKKRFEMPVGYELKIAQRVWTMHYGLVRAIVNRKVRSRLAARGIELSKDIVQDMVDDAVARSWEQFCRVLPRHASPVDALRHAARISARKVASRRESPLGSPRTKGYQDALDHRGTTKAIGLDDLPGKHRVNAMAIQEAQAAFDAVIATLPVRIRATAEYASRGVSQVDSAILQCATDRTIRNHYVQLRKILGGRILYGYLCSALIEAIAA